MGHLLNERGHSFTREKINHALEIIKPVVAHQMKKFLGVIGYFRMHLRNLSMVLKPLERMVLNYKRNSKEVLKWTEEANKAYDDVMVMLNNIPTLYFMVENAPVFLHTDASDYGIGAYLFQVVDGEERPVVFLSKSLSGSQVNWSVPEKEAYAIVYALTKLDYLLRDIPFTLRTDHANLTFINEGGSPKVLRWKLLIQEYNFKIEWFPGENNVVADAFSRLCTLTEEITIKIPSDIYREISKIHNSIVGHFGFDITYNRIRAKGNPHPFMREYVKKFIQACPCCQKMRYLKIPIHTSPFVTSSFLPMQRLNVDAIGPLPISERGHTHILVVIDTFTRFVELYPIVDTSGIEAAYALINHAGRYGIPNEILSDNGPQFVNKIIESLTSLLKVQHKFSIAYSKEENAIVERVNREVMRHLRGIMFEAPLIQEWWLYLPMVMRLLNAKIHETTNVSPAQLLFGNAIDLDQQLITDPEKLVPTKLSQWSSDMLQRQHNLIKIAQKNINVRNLIHLKTKETDELSSCKLFFITYS